MFALYIDNAGTIYANRFDVVRLLMAQYGLSSYDAKLVLTDVRVRVMTGNVSELQSIQEKLEDLGASAVIELCAEGNDTTSPLERE